ncbi:MAG TPA: hypothetical protein VK858_21245, partial [Longimicrobiales bacterium]|nr:hypothetical protein [Longimicrobiales bacterium]
GPRPTVPPHVDAVVARALERIPADRFASVAEMQAALQDGSFRHRVGGVHGIPAPEDGPHRRRGAVAALGALSAVLLVAALAGWMRSGVADPGPWRVFDLQVPDGGWTARESFALSPDGELLAYIDTLRHLRVVSLSGGPALTVPKVPEMVLPRFSQDGRHLAYGQLGGSSGATIWFIPVEGASTGTVIGRVPRPDWVWGAGGEIFFGTEDGARIYRRPGAPVETPPQPEGAIEWVLQGLPDGRVLVVVGDEAAPNVAVWDPVTGELVVAERQPETAGLNDARLVGDLLFWTDVDQVLKAARFDPEGGGVMGDPVRLIQPVAPAETGSSFEVTADGLLLAGIGLSAFRGEDENVAWVGLDGTIDVIHEGWASEFGDFDEAAPSPDGRWAAVQVEAGSAMPGQGQNQIWVLDLEQRTSYRLTFEGNAVQPVWLPDGRIVYRRDRDDRTAVLMAQPYDRSGSEEVLVEPGRQIWEYDALPDGSGLIVVVEDEDSNDNLYRVDLSRPDELVPLLTGPFDEWAPVVSPDGRWLAYSSSETGNPQIFVRAFPEMGRPWRISTGREDGRGLGATWAPDGTRIYIAGLRNMNAYTLTEASDGLRVQGPQPLFPMLPFEEGRVWMDGAGERFLMKVEPEQTREAHLRLHLNVFDEIERRMEAR